MMGIADLEVGVYGLRVGQLKVGFQTDWEFGVRLGQVS